MKNFFLRYALVIAAVLAGSAQAQTFQTFPNDPLNVKQFVLPNGLTVMLHEDHNKAEVFGAVVVRAGGKYDPKDATGMGHYLEHMLFKGTTTLGTTDYAAEKVWLDKIDSLYEELGKNTDPAKRTQIQKEINSANLKASQYAIANEMDQLLQSIGSTGVNAYTDDERIVYHNQFPSHQLEKWMSIYAHRFQEPIFRLFQSELETVYEERNRATDNMGYRLITTVNKNLFKNHPYGTQEILGTAEHLKNPSLLKMKEYYNKYYVASNMALVLSGDITPQQVYALANQYFATLPKGNLPAYPSYPEKPFNGREVVQIRATPVKVGVMAYRTVPKGHADEAALEVTSYLLNNDNETGLLDKLKDDGKILEAQCMPSVKNDHGAMAFIVVPKIIGQKMASAEQLILDQLKRLREGNFSDTIVQIAKNNIRRERLEAYENNEEKAELMVQAFAAGASWADFIQYENRLNAVTRADVQRVANTYLGSNYLMVESRMGSPKKEKLPKPPFEAVKNETEGKRSAFAQSWDKLPAGTPQPRFVDYKKDFTLLEPFPECKLYATPNPVNNIFTLNISFRTGTNHNLRYGYAAEYLERLGTTQHSIDQLKAAFGLLGISYAITPGANYTHIYLTGFEENLGKALPLLVEWMNSPKGDASKLKLLAEEAKAEEKVARKEPAQLARLLVSYVEHGDKGKGLRRLTVKEIKELNGDTLLADLRRIFAHPYTIHFVGKTSAANIQSQLQQAGLLNKPTRSVPEVYFPYRAIDKTQVYFFNDGSARQSQLHFFAKAQPYSKEQDPGYTAFGEYYGGMNGIVFQEIREFRSLAYTAYAHIRRPQKPGQDNVLEAYIGCQADKTNEAITEMMKLLTVMPAKTERLEGLRTSLYQLAVSNRPDMRGLTKAVDNWKERGYLTRSPNEEHLAAMKNMTFEQLQAYFDQTLKGRPIAIVVLGDKSKIDMKKLQEYGPVNVMKESDFYRR